MELVAFNIPSKPTVSLKTNFLSFDYLAHPHKTSSANLPSLPPPSSALHSFQRPDSDPHFFFSQSTRLSHCQPGPFYLHANGDLCCKKDIGACTGLVSAVSEGSADGMSRNRRRERELRNWGMSGNERKEVERRGNLVEDTG